MSSSKSGARRSSPYDDDPMVRLTGLSLDPEFPPHHSGAPSNSPLPAGGNDQKAADKGKGTAEANDDTPASPAAEENFDAGDRDQYHDEDVQHNGGEPYLTLRALVTTREAGVIIGKGGKNVAEVREVANVKAGVSKVVSGVHERILTVSGQLDAVAKAYHLIAKHLLENPIETTRQQREPAHPDCTTIRLLVAHQLMGSIIGKGGSRIRDIQEESGARIVISKEMLPNSTERVIEIYGLVDSIQIAVYQISECILHDLDRASGTILYSPENQVSRSIRSPRSGDRYGEYDSPRYTGDRRGGRRTSFGESSGGQGGRRGHARGDSHGNGVQLLSNGSAGGDQRTQTLGIPVDMVGCIIGKGGSFINQIRRTSGAKLRIDELQEGQTSRMVTITGTDGATKKALSMIYNQLESEKQRRLEQDNENDESHQDYE